MLAAERRAKILDAARRDGVVRAADLVQEFGVSLMTVRRDLDAMARDGLVDKVHGGATVRALLPFEPEATMAPASSLQIGVVVPTEYYFRRIVDGIRSVSDQSNGRLILALSDYHADDERLLIANLVRSHVDGLVLAPSIGGYFDDPDYAEELRRLPVPTVLVERELPGHGLDALTTVRTAHERGIGAALDHLFQRGHKRIVLVDRGRTHTAALVRQGWRQAVSELGLPDDVHDLSSQQLGPGGHWEPGKLDEVFEHLRLCRATALVCHGDEDVLAINQHARRRGWRIPDDLSIVAYDDELAGLADPPLTAVAPAKERVGEAAARLLLALMDADNPPPIQHVLVQPRFVVRDSVADLTGDPAA